jgi:hypothetical protein
VFAFIRGKNRAALIVAVTGMCGVASAGLAVPSTANERPHAEQRAAAKPAASIV